MKDIPTCIKHSTTLSTGEYKVEFDKIESRVMPNTSSIIELKQKGILVLESSFVSTVDEFEIDNLDCLSRSIDCIQLCYK